MRRMRSEIKCEPPMNSIVAIECADRIVRVVGIAAIAAAVIGIRSHAAQDRGFAASGVKPPRSQAGKSRRSVNSTTVLKGLDNQLLDVRDPLRPRSQTKTTSQNLSEAVPYDHRPTVPTNQSRPPASVRRRSPLWRTLPGRSPDAKRPPAVQSPKPLARRTGSSSKADGVDGLLREALSGEFGGEDIGIPNGDSNPLARINKQKMRSVAKPVGKAPRRLQNPARAKADRRRARRLGEAACRSAANSSSQKGSSRPRRCRQATNSLNSPQAGQNPGNAADQPALQFSCRCEFRASTKQWPPVELVEKAIDRLNTGEEIARKCCRPR